MRRTDKLQHFGDTVPTGRPDTTAQKRVRLAWEAEMIAEALASAAASDLVDDRDVDWPNIAEEIEDAGGDRLHAVESLLVQALRHMLKAEVWPLSLDVPTWLADAVDFRRQVRRRFVPSMR